MMSENQLPQHVIPENAESSDVARMRPAAAVPCVRASPESAPQRLAAGTGFEPAAAAVDHAAYRIARPATARILKTCF
jgi:hypothetical protein